MFLRLLPVLLCLLSIPVIADSAVQTDWSGGPWIWQPVLTWGDEFYCDTDIAWSQPGSITLDPLEYPVEYGCGTILSAHSADVDNDGSVDIAGALSWADQFVWWENSDGAGTAWVKHTVKSSVDAPSSVQAADIDGDGYIDIVGTAENDGDIIWWENSDGSGTAWVEHPVDLNFPGAKSLYVNDIDGDDDLDVVSGSVELTDEIRWWENLNGSGTAWIQHSVPSTSFYATCVFSEDINGDDYMDILASEVGPQKVSWWENTDGTGTSWVQHSVSIAFNSPSSIHAADIDGDGFTDIIASDYATNTIIWWKNVDGSGTSWSEHTIDDDFTHVRSVRAVDIDEDGHLDVIAAAESADEIAWWENSTGTGTVWTKHPVADDFDHACCVITEDINGDGNTDVAGFTSTGGDATWWDISRYTPTGSLESLLLDTQCSPVWNYIDWDADTTIGTSIGFQVRSMDDPDTPTTWSDTLWQPCSVEGILTDGQAFLQYRAILITSTADAPVLNDVTITWNQMGVEEGSEPKLPEILLLSISPNPSASPAVRFGVPDAARIALSVFDLSGRLVLEVLSAEYSAGYHTEVISGLTPGIYFCRMTTGEFTATQRFVVVE